MAHPELVKTLPQGLEPFSANKIDTPDRQNMADRRVERNVLKSDKFSMNRSKGTLPSSASNGSGVHLGSIITTVLTEPSRKRGERGG